MSSGDEASQTISKKSKKPQCRLLFCVSFNITLFFIILFYFLTYVYAAINHLTYN